MGTRYRSIWVLTRAGGTPPQFTSDVRSMMLGLHPIVFLSWSSGPLFPAAEALLKLGALYESVPPRPPRRSSSAAVQWKKKLSNKTAHQQQNSKHLVGLGLRVREGEASNTFFEQSLLRIDGLSMGLHEASHTRDF